MSNNLWPSNPESATPAKGILWNEAHPMSFQAKPSVWKKISVEAAQRLRTDPRYIPMFNTLSAEVQEIVNAIADKRPVEHAKPVEKAGRTSTKDDLISRIESVISDAADDGDTAGRLKGIEMIAKLHALMTQKVAEDDRVVTINVVTGVVR